MNVNLTTNYIGQYVEFTYDTPLRGLMNISSFTDTITGQTGSRFFKKEFCYTMDGVKYSDWQPLTTGNLTALGTLPIKNDFIIKFRYTRAGTGNTGALTVNTMIINGTFSLAYLQTLDFSNSVFQDIGFTDEYWNKVWINLLKKLYEHGVVPVYIERGEDNPKDDDYITFWKSVAYFYALTIALVDDKVSQIMTKQEELAEYLLEKGVFVSQNDDVTVLNVIANNIYDQMRRRATQSMISQDGTFDSPVAHPVHGELLRLICYDIVLDEFLFEYIKNSGWYVDFDSPTYFGLTKHLQLNKSSEQTENIQSLSNYLIGGGVSLATDSGHQVVNIPASSSVTTPFVKVDDTLDYEFTFMVKASTNPYLRVYVYATDHLGYVKTTNSIRNNVAQTDFVSAYAAANGSVYYFFKGILFNKAASLMPIASDYLLNIQAGQHLKMNAGGGIERVQFTIENIAPVSHPTNIKVYDIKIRPLQSFKNPIYINGGDMTRLWVKNRNFNLQKKINPYHKLTTDDALNIKMRQSLIPLESDLIMHSIGSDQVNNLNDL